MFVLHDAILIPLSDVPNAILCELIEYWRKLCAARRMPERSDFDPIEVRHNIGRLHLLKSEGPDIFRYIIYGSKVTNPNKLDMTGLTTGDYPDKNFAQLVTTHATEVAASGEPRCYRINAEVDNEPYCYIRLMLPLGNEDTVTHILVGTQRIDVSSTFYRDVPGAN